jgi:serine/threonine protein kinase
MSDIAVPQDTGLDVLVGQVADEFTERLNRGEQPDVEEYARRYPQIAYLLRQLLPTLEVIGPPSAHSAPSNGTGASASNLAGCLGDFRIVREIGRGGMGIVYEAEQISLNRRVALKVLPFAATMDPRHLQRFKNESLAAAGLHHPNIVPVHYVGCERGVHFFAMQLIEGPTLAAILQQLRQPKGPNQAGENALAKAGPEEPTGPYSPAPAAASPDQPPAASEAATVEMVAALTTEGAAQSPAYFREVARLGIQAAEALEHAHQLGVVHRDVKPGNLLLDARGNLWVTDFGLARLPNDPGLTLTGDLVGTLRYMSPEQALAKRVVIDHRTDVYSLGATLYELLTLRPVFDGKDRQELLRQIAFEDPKPPRRWNKAIPADLETITLKAMAKEPSERYATAKELAEDLRCWLEDRPIQARRPTLAQRASKWCKRHLAAVWTAAVVLVLAVAGLTTGALLLAAAYQDQAWQRQQAEEARNRAEKAREAKAKERKRANAGWAEAAKQLADAKANLHDAFALASDSDLLNGKSPDVNEKTLRRMIIVLEKAVSEESQIINHRRQLFLRLRDLSVHLEDGGRSPEAVDAMRRALAVLNRCLADFPNNPEVRFVYPYHLTGFLNRLGNLLRDTGGLKEAEKVYSRALDLAQQQMKRAPSFHSFWQTVSLWNDLGTVRLEAGQLKAAKQAYKKALGLMEPKLPDATRTQSRLVRLPARGAQSLSRWAGQRPVRVRQVGGCCPGFQGGSPGLRGDDEAQ